MRVAWVIARREVGAYFSSPAGWVVLCTYLVLSGVFFVSSVSNYSYESSQLAYSPWTEQSLNVNDFLVIPWFGNMAVVLLFLCPAITMRLLAEDRRSGAIELLLTSPITTWQIVLGKFLGAVGFVAVLLAGTLPCTALLFWLGDPDPGVVAAGYVTEILLSGALLAAGLLASAFTRSQVTALVASFGLVLVLWVISWADPSSSDTVSTVLAAMSMVHHLENPLRGLLNVEDIVYFTSFVGVFLFATWQRLESGRWT